MTHDKITIWLIDGTKDYHQYPESWSIGDKMIYIYYKDKKCFYPMRSVRSIEVQEEPK